MDRIKKLLKKWMNNWREIDNIANWNLIHWGIINWNWGNRLLLTETIFPSVGMYAGLLDKRNFVCNVLKLVSSLAFCSTRGGLCLRLYVRYSSSLFCTPDKELSACLLCNHGNVRLIHSKSCSTKKPSFQHFQITTTFCFRDEII